MSQVESDRRLLARIRERGAGAFDEFVARYGDRILAFGMRVCGEREDARDVSLRRTVALLHDVDRPPLPDEIRRRVDEVFRRLEEELGESRDS